ncbi:MAG: hypothetical protein DMD67_10165, partial [Gemmatimonadetes bacterium]
GGAVGARPAVAQGASGTFAQGIRAYQNLEFGRAAATLRRDLARLSAAGAPAADRVQGLVYLGAADLFRGRRDSAVAVFKRLVQLDPRFLPDRLVFPPEVTTVFDSVRALTKTVAIVVSPDTQVAPGEDNFGAWVVASSFQTVEVTFAVGWSRRGGPATAGRSRAPPGRLAGAHGRDLDHPSATPRPAHRASRHT